MTAITLRTGETVDQGVYRSTMISLELLWKNNPIAVAELVAYARNHQHAMFGNTRDVVERHGLMEHGQLHASTRDVILASFEGDEDSLQFVSALGEE